MMTSAKYLVGVALALAGCHRTEARRVGAIIPSGWVAVAPPLRGSDAARCANYASEAWDVALTDDGKRLAISPTTTDHRADTIRVGDDMLIGDNAGEFGGAIWQQIGVDARDTLHVKGRDSQALRVDNLLAFVRRKDEVYAVTGLAHGHFNIGELLYLVRIAGRWEARTVLNLKNAPRAIARVAQDTLLVLTTDSLLAITLDPFKPTRHALAGDAVWSGTYGYSLVRDWTGVIFIGMRSAVGRLRPDSQGYREDWLVPDQCRYRAPGKDFQCSCKASDN